MIVGVKVFVVVLGLGVAVPVNAQQREADQSVADKMQAAQKEQLQLFEMVLRRAVDRGGRELVAWVQQLGSPVLLDFTTPAIISGVPIPQRGVVFDVNVPNIGGTAILQAVMSRQPSTTQNSAGQINVANSSKGNIMAAGGVVPPDPMRNPPMDPNDQYSEFVRQALIDSILDSSVMLNLKDDEMLTVAAHGLELNPNSLYANNSRKLILHMKGADLNLLHQGKITRDEAKNRMIEIRF